MAIDKITPRVLSKDKDQRIVTNSEFTDANNIRVTVDSEGNGGIIKNLKSDLAIPMGSTLASGTNTVIGCYAFELINTVYVLVHNSEGDHSIWYFDLDGTDAELLLQETALGFLASDYYYIDGVLFNNEPFLYMTNGRSEPIKININACIAGGWPTGSTTAEKMLELAVAKAQPKSPTAVFSTDLNKKTHGLYQKAFQFAAQYVYRDGEESALGHYSELFVAPNTLNETIRTHSWESEYNKLEVEVPATTASVEKVRLYMRNNSTSPWYFVEEKSNTSGVATSFNFYNDKVYTVFADEEANKLFDAVPKKASAQTFAGGRIVYGNYTEGFDVTAQSATITPVYNNEPLLEDLPLSYYTSLSPNTNKHQFLIDVSSLPTQGDGGKYTLNARTPRITYQELSSTRNITVEKSGVYIGTPTGNSALKFTITNSEISLSASIPSWSDYSDLASEFYTAFSGTEIDLSVFTPNDHTPTSVDYQLTQSAPVQTYDVYYTGNTVWEITGVAYTTSYAGQHLIVTLELVSANLSSRYIEKSGVEQVGWSSEFDFIYSGTPSFVTSHLGSFPEQVSYFVDSEGEKTFKSGESHSFGIVFVDKYGRQSGVQELGSVNALNTGAGGRLGKQGSVHFDIDLTGTPPIWADSFFFVYGGGSTYNNYTQYAITEAFPYENGSPKVVLSLRGLQGNDRSYSNANGANISYTYSKGDRIRIISYMDNNGTKVYPDSLEFDIVDFITVNDVADAPFTATDGTTADQSERSVGQFLVVDPRNYDGFSHGDCSSNTDFWANECLVEMYNDGKSNTDSNIYYGCSKLYPRTDYVNVIRVTEGNAYYKPRLIIGFSYNSTDPYTDADVAEMQSYVSFVESSEYSDFAENSAHYGKGKPNAVIAGEKENVRFSGLAWSEELNTDSTALLTSSFNNSLANWYDLEATQGNIQGISNKAAFLVVMQKEGIALVKTNRVFIENAEQTITALNQSFIADHSYFDSKIGIQYRGSFVSAEGQVIGVDVLRGLVFSVGNDGVKIISEAGLSKYFADYCTSILEHDARGNEDILEINSTGIGMVNLQLGYDRRNKEVIINRVDLTSTILPSSGSETVYGWSKDYSNKSIVYNIKEEVWASLRDLVADGFASANNRFFAARLYNGSPLHEQEAGSSYGIFFGVQSQPSFTIISALGASGVKKYNAISIEGNQSAQVNFTTRSQTASLAKSRFSEKEETFYSEIPHASGTSEYITIGKVESVSGNDVTFYNKINRVPFKSGGDVYKLSGTSLSQISATADALVSSNTLTLSSASSVVSNDTLVVKADSGIDGDQLSGHYLEAEFTFDNADSVSSGGVMEIYAINLDFSASSLHHEGNE